MVITLYLLFSIKQKKNGIKGSIFSLFSNVLLITVFNSIAVFGDTNLELPSFLSNRSAVEIHLDVDPNALLEPIDISIELPLHARYQVRQLWFKFSLNAIFIWLAHHIYFNLMFGKGNRVIYHHVMISSTRDQDD